MEHCQLEDQTIALALHRRCYNVLQRCSLTIDGAGDSGRGGYESVPSSLTCQSQSYGGGRDGEHAADREDLMSSSGVFSFLKIVLFKEWKNRAVHVRRRARGASGWDVSIVCWASLQRQTAIPPQIAITMHIVLSNLVGFELALNQIKIRGLYNVAT